MPLLFQLFFLDPKPSNMLDVLVFDFSDSLSVLFSNLHLFFHEQFYLLF